jgi:putative endonuclease
MYFVYALHSPAFGKIYIGFSPNPEKRLIQHNDPRNDGWTRSFQPWFLVYKEKYNLKTDALKREKQLKSSRGRSFIWEIVKNNPLSFQHSFNVEDS